MMRTLLSTAVAAVFLSAAATGVEAKRVGGGKTVGSTKPTTSTQAKKPDEATSSAARPVGINLPRVSTSSGAQPQQRSVAPAVAAGVAAGAVAGSVAAAPVTDKKREAELAALQKRFDDEAKLRKLDAEQKKADEATAAAAEQKKREREETQKRAALEREKEAKRARAEREAQCQIRPVMTDEDIAKCRALRD